MKRSARFRPTPALIIAMIALFVALGGGATAGTVLLITGAQIKNNTITNKDIKNGTVNSKDIKNNSIRTGDVRNGTLLAEDFKAGQLPTGATGPAGPAGAAGATGAAGPAGPAGSALAYVRVNADGTFVAAKSKGVTAVDSSGALYCIDFTDLTQADIHTASATLITTGIASPGEIDAGTNGCSVGGVVGEVFVRTYDSAGAAAIHIFDLVIN